MGGHQQAGADWLLVVASLSVTSSLGRLLLLLLLLGDKHSSLLPSEASTDARVPSGISPTHLFPHSRASSSIFLSQPTAGYKSRVNHTTFHSF